MPNSPIQSPASFVPSRAAAYSDVDGTALLVSAATPLPVTMAAVSGTAPTPLAGTTATTGVLGPYQPALGRDVVLALSGTWAGTIKVTRSTDGGTTRLPLTAAGTSWAQFTGNCCEAVWEESDGNARLYLDVTLTSGTLVYRMAQ
ncbi:MAG: hypothetical protein ACKOQ3_02505 [Novosphingobium sp.]